MTPSFLANCDSLHRLAGHPRARTSTSPAARPRSKSTTSVPPLRSPPSPFRHQQGPSVPSPPSRMAATCSAQVGIACGYGMSSGQWRLLRRSRQWKRVMGRRRCLWERRSYQDTTAGLSASFVRPAGSSPFSPSCALTAPPFADVDPTCRWMFTTSGNRAWEGTSTENLVIHETKTVAAA